MTKQEILESGVLETYVLGGCTEEERTHIELVSSKDLEIREAILAYHEVLENVALDYAVELPGKVKESLKSTLDFNEKNSEVSPRFNLWKGISIAASVAAMISVAGNFYLTNQVNSVKSALDMAQLRNQKMAFETGNLKEIQTEASSQLNLLLSENKKIVVMNGQAFAPQAKATVYWNGGDVYLHANAFPVNSKDTQFQLWAIVDGKPMDAGVFDVDKEGSSKLIKLKNITNATAFAVTQEKKGGSPTPTLEKMLVLGMVES